MTSVFSFLVLSVGVCWSTRSAGEARNPADQTEKGAQNPVVYIAPSDPECFIGTETCKAGHDKIYAGFEKTAHFASTMDSKLDPHRSVEWHGCEACHGPGKEHVDDGGDRCKIFNGSGHNRSVGFSLSVTPSQKFSAHLGYNYDNISSQRLICFTSSFAQPGLPADPDLTGLLQQLSPYSSSNTGFLDFLWTPLQQLSLEVGASLSEETS